MAVAVNGRVRVKDRADRLSGTVIRLIATPAGEQADVAFEQGGMTILETYPVDLLVSLPGIWDKVKSGQASPPLDFLLKQLAYQFPLANSGGQLSNSKTDLLPHQILLTHDVVRMTRRRLLIADEVGLGKTIETGMIIRELMARREAERILVITPAGLTANWQNEMRDCFRIYFEIFGRDFSGAQPDVWERRPRVIASIDTLKKTDRMEKLLAGPRWDLVIFDEAHHLSRTRYGRRVEPTQNYRLAEALNIIDATQA